MKAWEPNRVGQRTPRLKKLQVHSHTRCVSMLYGTLHSVMVYNGILYHPTPKPTPYRKISAFLYIKKNHSVWFINSFPHEDQNISTKTRISDIAIFVVTFYPYNVGLTRTTHSRAHAHAHARTQSRTHSHAYTHTRTHTHNLTHHTHTPRTHSHSLTLTHTISHLLSHTRTLALIHTPLTHTHTHTHSHTFETSMIIGSMKKLLNFTSCV